MPTFVHVFGLVPLRIGGMERLIREIAMALEEQGWKTLVVFAGEPAAEVRCFLDLPSLTIKVIPKFDRNWWAALLSLASVLRLPEVRCIHFHFTSPLDPIFLLARWHGARCFLTVHDSMPEFYQPHAAAAWKRTVARTLVRAVERVFCVSHFVQDYMTTRGYFPPEKLCTIYNGVYVPKLEKLAPLRAKYRLQHSLAEHSPMILQVGQLISSKGVEDLLEAAPFVLKRFPDAKFMFVGEGPEEAFFRERAASLRIEHAVRWCGLDIDPCGNGTFAAADIVCVPSRWQEAFGLASVEGMAHAIPVVAAQTGGIGEIVVHGETGFLVDRRNPGQLAERINELLGNPDVRQRMGRAAYDRVKLKFNLPDTVRKMIDNYSIVAAQPALSSEPPVRCAGI